MRRPLSVIAGPNTARSSLVLPLPTSPSSKIRCTSWVDAWMRTPLPRLAAWMVWAALALLTTRAEADPEIDGGRDRRRQGGGAGRSADLRHAGPRSAAARAWSSTAAGLVLTIGYLILEATSVDLYPADGKRDTRRHRRLRSRYRLRPGAGHLPLGMAPIRLGQQQGRGGRRPAARAQPRRQLWAAARPSWPAGASSPATGSTSCPTPCSRPRRTASSPAPR